MTFRRIAAAILALCVSLCVQAAERVWIDVRSDAEYAGEHIVGDLHVPHDQIGARIEAMVPDRDTPIELYCRSGGRAGIAKKVLEDMGYTHVHNAGGIGDVRQARATGN